MYAEERQQAIVDEVRVAGRASVAALAEKFDVTSETVRRDLAVLERTGHLQRVHGGAVRAEVMRVVGELGIDERESSQVEQKAAIGRAAVRFLPPEGGSVLFDAGTTTYRAAEATITYRAAEPTGRDHDLTIITNSLPIAGLLAGRPRTGLHALGGRVRGLTQATVGADTVAAVTRLRVSTAFIGTNGLSEAHGLSTPDPAEAAVKTAMVAAARQVVVLADSSKMQREDLLSFAGIDDVDVLITDDRIDPAFSAALSARGIEVVIA
ncbi:DeoR/GlpR transcriptional regulator [Gordonia sp. zg691]|uniref:Lactose phosphotransferase system repressor n=1 Tax=Gordonia jinghuaiqii TaxID=2758710 RepID=A0A7D7M0K2_9ACTN|nr:DeoR/GlpR family DNA-binding transcription regulator [Gordonia jinghuaiqii]MBD0861370.1 DeoR/GlpR transcriptional regulator [Gordonia jinghuaiqii]MCR5976270.1 DeoR family transcriptional regulator [Gordonia jinghuaiqii]QMT03494.1 DeoR/GlpR transcriptional regulator [Gordonia jinghuaiqii]